MMTARITLGFIAVLLFCSHSVFAATIHVPADQPTIQAGIDAALPGDTVLVADGSYKGAGNKDLDFKGKAITVQSANGADNCIIDCENDGRGFYFHSGEGAGSILSGFTITKGQADGGAGINCENSSPTIRSCIITGNSSTWLGGGGIRTRDSSATISDCIIKRNSTTWFGGGINCYSSSPIVNNCTIETNVAAEGGGIHSAQSAFPSVANCRIRQNTANSGSGILIRYASAAISNSIVNSNSGAGILCADSSDVLITNCTVSDNSVGITMGSCSGILISNSIFWGNSDTQFQQSYSTVSGHHSIIGGGWGGEGNLDVDPLFVDPSTGNYNLSDRSPCISAGTSVGAPATDIDGNPRPSPAGSYPDMGAYENPLAMRTAPPLDIFGMGVGNRWTYNGIYQATLPYILDKEVLRIDPSSFSVPTYVVEETISGSNYGSWYQALPGELRLWGTQEEGSSNPLKFSSGLTVAWFPAAVGNQRVTDATMVIEGYTVNVRMTVNIVAQELVNLGFGSLNAYKARYEFRLWNSSLGYDETDTWYYWMVPYLGIIKYQDSELNEDLTSFAIGEGTLSHQSDADYDGLKDYQEILHGTDWLNMDSDGDGLADGQEDVNGNGIVDAGERDPRVKDPTFGPDSANITNPYSPLSANMKLRYAGTGIYAGYGRYYQVIGREVVDSVQCLKVAIKGHGNNKNPYYDTEWYTVWLAQDASGVVWLLKHYEALLNTYSELGRSNAIVWAPPTFAVGQRFGEIGDSYREVVETGVTVNLGTGLGPYTNCVKVKCVEGADEDFIYLAQGVGIVKEEWNDGGLTNGWVLLQILTGAVADELVVNFGPAYGLWQYDQAGGWTQWNTVNPSQMVTVDLNGDGTDELVAAFPGYGLYTYDSADGWQLINTVIPEFMSAYRNGIACDLGAAYGLWLWDQTGGWQQINTVDPNKMIAADIDGDGEDELVAGFIGYGLYSYVAPGVWTQINALVPDAIVRYSHGVVFDYGAAYGLWSYSPVGGWVELNTADPDKIVMVDIDNDSQDELVVSFVGYGLYIYEPVGSIWVQINTVVPDGMIRQGNGIAVDFGATHGLWYWDASGGWVQRNTADPGQMTVVDIDKDGVEELVVSFSGYGLYYFDETNGWQLLNTVLPVGMKPINFCPLMQQQRSQA